MGMRERRERAETEERRERINIGESIERRWSSNLVMSTPKSQGLVSQYVCLETAKK